jgi:RNA polymerase sigma-70 factor, ECF subfamily
LLVAEPAAPRPFAPGRAAPHGRRVSGMYRPMSALRSQGEAELIAGLRAGEDDAFVELVDTYAASLMRVAALYVRDRAVVQEVVQETWLGVMRGIHRFEGRSSLGTWLFSILTNTAKTRAVREARTVPFAALSGQAEDEPSVSPDHFLGPDSAWPGHWATGPAAWASPLEDLLTGETRQMLRGAIEQLPAMQRSVVTLRDVEGWSSQEVCDALEISEANQRVLLHRGRTRLREAIDRRAVGGVS